MANPYPIERENRQSPVLTATGGQTVFSATGFKIWDVEDLQIWKKPAASGPWAIVGTGFSVAKTSAEVFDHAVVTFDAGLDAGDLVQFRSARIHERLGSVTQGGIINSVNLERELDRLATMAQETRRDLDNRAQFLPGGNGLEIESQVLRNVADGNEDTDGVNRAQVVGLVAPYAALASDKADEAAASAASAAAQAFTFTLSAAPSSGLGVDGDTAFNIVDGSTYLKTVGVWGLTGSLQGPALVGGMLAANNLGDLDSIPGSLANLGLENIDNTSDPDKPVSTAQQLALNYKLGVGGGVMIGPIDMAGNELKNPALGHNLDAKNKSIVDLDLINGVSPLGVPHAILEEQFASGTEAGTFTSGAWVVRKLNAKVYDPYSLISLSGSNEITSTVNGYIIWLAPAYQVGGHKTRFFNVTDSLEVRGSASAYSSASSATQTLSIGWAFVLVGKSYRIEHWAPITSPTFGLGVAGGLGPEIYTVAKFWKM